MYKFGLIGNCQVSALSSHTGSLEWLCFPRPDSDPIFGRLLDVDGGHFTVSFAGEAKAESLQYYVESTNVLITELMGSDGSRIRITDFCPRFGQFGRMYRPATVIRMVEPLAGNPLLQVVCAPVEGWSKVRARGARGNSHMRYDIRGENLRLTTNMPMTFLVEEKPFHLREKVYFSLSWGSSSEEDLGQFCERMLTLTLDYWRLWVKHCSIPTRFQKEVIRSALALKLHCYEDTGAILAAVTTSLPEQIGQERNWDYRYCWLRDSYFVLSAFHNLGHFEEMEGFIKFLLDLSHNLDLEDRLAPVYTLGQELPLPETIHAQWAGFKGSAPVRSQNQAAEHVQNDAYGEMVLTLSPIFFDERFARLRTPEHERLLGRLGELCAKTISVPDAGLWEIRNGWQEHSFSNLLSWAGLERIERIQKAGYLKDLKLDVAGELARAERAIRKAVKDQSLRNGPDDDTLDSSLALLSVLRFPDIALANHTLDQIQAALRVENSTAFFYRYLRRDDFGRPHSAFVICSFWIAQGLAHAGRKKEALAMIERVLEAANPVGLYAEHFLPSSRTQFGNFPQAYSHVGLINAAFAASPPWSDVL